MLHRQGALSLLLLAGCGGGGGGQDTTPPVIHSFSSQRALYDEGETVQFSGSSSDDRGSPREWADVSQWADTNGDGDVSNDPDLGGLTASYQYVAAGDYRPRGWAADSSGNIAFRDLQLPNGESLRVRPYRQLEDVRSSFSGMPGLVAETVPLDWTLWLLAKAALSPATRGEITPFESAIAARNASRPDQETIQSVTLVRLQGAGKLLYENVCPSYFFPGSRYEGLLPLSPAAYNDVFCVVKVLNPPGLPFSLYGTVNGGSGPNGALVEAWIDANGNGAFERSGAPTPSGSENLDLLKQPSQTGWYGVIVPADNPLTTQIEGLGTIDTCTIVVGGQPYRPAFRGTAGGSYRHDVVQ